MTAFASSAQDRWLDLNDVLRELVNQGRVDQNTAEQCTPGCEVYNCHGSPSRFTGR